MDGMCFIRANTLAKRVAPPDIQPPSAKRPHASEPESEAFKQAELVSSPNLNPLPLPGTRAAAQRLTHITSLLLRFVPRIVLLIPYWPEHKVICKDTQLERTLARVAEIVHEAYLTFRENTWDGVIKKVEDKEDVLIIHDGNLVASKDWFRKFPYDVVPSNKRTKMAVLTAWMCNEPYAFLHLLIKKLLEGLKVDAEEIQVTLTDVPRETVTVFYNGQHFSTLKDTQHTLLRLTARQSRKQWVFDVCGGQYGIVQPLHTWAQYETDYVKKIDGIHAFGTTRKVFDELAVIRGYPILTYRLVDNAASVLHRAVETWATQNMVLDKLLPLESSKFEPLKTDLLAALALAVRSFMDTSDFTAVIRGAKAYERKYPGVSRNVVGVIAERQIKKGKLSLGEPSRMISSSGLYPVMVTGPNGETTKAYCYNLDDF
ncbi:hypothetical protein N0V95_007873 [Ascochyta clinopodiicola]|nr:hypothetical protein N0V95_007873 [Ascochyta clinopodiicola]